MKVKPIMVYPMASGRNLDEVTRVIDSRQLTASHKGAAPVNSRPGENVIVAGSLSDDEATRIPPPRTARNGRPRPPRGAAD